MNINLNDCKPGDKCRTRNGAIMEYAEYTGADTFPHLLRQVDIEPGARSYRDNGAFVEEGTTDYDIVAILTTPVNLS